MNTNSLVVTKYKSEVTNDEFNICEVAIKYNQPGEIGEKITKTVTKITIYKIDDLIENLSLINKLVNDLATKGETHVLYRYNKFCVYPQFRLEKIYVFGSSHTLFTVEQFRNFYLDNIQNIIEPSNVHVSDKKIEDEDDDGWTIVGDTKQKRCANKIKELKNIANGIAVMNRHSLKNKNNSCTDM